jgi:glycosyltransferase involved in cell wall biosynthesis
VLKGEAFGLYQIESLASGIPLIQPGLGAFPEIIGSTGGGLIYTPNTPEKLAAAIAEILSDRDRLEKMSHAGRRSVEQFFDSRKLTDKMISIYENLTR